MVTIVVGTAIRCCDCCHVSSPLKHRYRLTKSLLWIRRENIRFAAAHVVSIDLAVSKRCTKLLLQRDQRIVISDRVRRELKNELIAHGGFGSNETEISHGRVSWQTR